MVKVSKRFGTPRAKVMSKMTPWSIGAEAVIANEGTGSADAGSVTRVKERSKDANAMVRRGVNSIG